MLNWLKRSSEYNEILERQKEEMQFRTRCRIQEKKIAMGTLYIGRPDSTFVFSKEPKILIQHKE